MSKKAFILNYHLIDDESQVFNELGAIYAVRKSDFEKQMQCLHDLQIPVVSLEQILKNTLPSDFCVAVTFDDGQSSDYEIAFPVLSHLGFTATFFLSHLHAEMNHCDMKRYREMADAGFSVGSHGMKHLDLTTLNKADLQHELSVSREWLEKELEHDVTLFSFPFGKSNNLVEEFALKSGYQSLFSTKFEMIMPKENRIVLGRWSVKRNTGMEDFRDLMKQQRFTFWKYKSVDKLKKITGGLLGTEWTNRLNSFRYKP